MTVGYATALRNSQLLAVSAAADAGTAAAIIRIYDGSRPETGGAVTNLLAELTMSDPAFAAPMGGVMVAGVIAPDTATNAAGVATWFRVVDSTGAFVLDGSVGLAGSGADMVLDDVNILINQELRLGGFSITEGNP